ncbi:MAG: cysteine desulfurase family protein [Planctomycetota bacterium]|nr:cysteine desulfurase family protein [Planctomycetota bacterium]
MTAVAYLDNNATTPIAPVVYEAMLPYLTEYFGNPSSSHIKGTQLGNVIDTARGHVASFLGAAADEITFTSGGSESNNHVLKGIFLDRQLGREGLLSGHLIISEFEHPAIQQPAAYLEDLGVRVTRVGCDGKGVIDPSVVEQAMCDDTRLVSIMHANNEIGAIQPIREIADLCHQHKVLCHTDAAQSLGKIDVDVSELQVDFLTLAGHKLYAPKGVGALFIRNGIKLESLIHGANHESGVRAGTENTPYWIGLGAACEMLMENPTGHRTAIAEMRDDLLNLLTLGTDATVSVNGQYDDPIEDRANRLPNTLSVNFPGVTGEQLLAATPHVCASTGAACHSGETKMSDTLRAIGLAADVAQGTVRLSLGWFTTPAEVLGGATELIKSWKNLTAAKR